MLVREGELEQEIWEECEHPYREGGREGKKV